MSAGYFDKPIRFATGLIATGAAIAVRDTGGTLSDIFSNEALSVSKSNPGVVDADGRFIFYADQGEYDITVGAGASAATYRVFIGANTDLTFSSRADLVTWWTSNSGDAPTGVVVSDGTVQYVKDGGTSISDLLGLSHHGQATPQHLGFTGDGVTDATTGIEYAFANNGRIPAGNWVIENAYVPADCKPDIDQGAVFIMEPSSLVSMFDVGSRTGIVFVGGEYVGNRLSQTSASSSSCMIKGTNGISGLIVKDVVVRDFTRHLIEVDGASDCWFVNVTGMDTHYGSGILLSSSNASTDMHVIDCKISGTQQANIHSYLPLTNSVITGNICDGTDNGNGSVADNITAYADGTGGNIIADNVCSNSGNHGIHVGGNNTVIGNKVVSPTNYGYVMSLAPNNAPAQTENLVMIGNSAEGIAAGRRGFSVKNYTGFVFSNNMSDGGAYAFEIVAEGAGASVRAGVLSGNTGKNATASAIHLNGDVTGVVIAANSVDDCAAWISETNGADIADQRVGVNSLSGTTPDKNVFESDYMASSSTISRLRAKGPDTNISAWVASKGNGTFRATRDNAGIEITLFSAGLTSSTAVAFPYVYGTTTLSRDSAFYSVDGTSATIDGVLTSKGAASEVRLSPGGTVNLRAGPTTVGFFGTAPAAQGTIAGSRGGNAALASLLTTLAGHGLIVDGSTA